MLTPCCSLCCLRLPAAGPATWSVRAARHTCCLSGESIQAVAIPFVVDNQQSDPKMHFLGFFCVSARLCKRLGPRSGLMGMCGREAVTLTAYLPVDLLSLSAGSRPTGAGQISSQCWRCISKGASDECSLHASRLRCWIGGLCVLELILAGMLRFGTKM